MMVLLSHSTIAGGSDDDDDDDDRLARRCFVLGMQGVGNTHSQPPS